MAKPPRQSGRRVSFSPEAAKRIGRAVLKVEAGDRTQSGTQLRTGGSDAEIVRGTFTAPWNKGATKTVTDAVLSAVTYEAKNYLTSFTGTGAKDCIISYVAGEWVLVGFDLLQLDGYSSGKSQVLGTVSGALKWIDTTDCATT